MSLRYPVRRPQEGDVPDPRDWNLNMLALADEANGGIDRNNLPENGATDSRRDVAAIFDLKTKRSTATSAVRTDTEAWQLVPNTRLDFTTNTEEMVEFEATVAWNCNRLPGAAATTYAASGAAAMAHRIYFQLVADGNVIAVSARIPMVYIDFVVYLVGARPLVVGTHTAEMRYRVEYEGAPGSEAWPATFNFVRVEVIASRVRR